MHVAQELSRLASQLPQLGSGVNRLGYALLFKFIS
jgi:hypothetical protein